MNFLFHSQNNSIYCIHKMEYYFMHPYLRATITRFR